MLVRSSKPIMRLILDGTAVRVRLDRIHRADPRPEVFVRCLRLLNVIQQGNSRNSIVFPATSVRLPPATFLEDIMRPSIRTILVSTLTLIVSSTLASAAEVRVLSVGSTQIAAKVIATEFEKQTRHKVTFTIRPPFDIDKELAEKTFDAVILSVPAMDNHDEAGDLAPMSRVALARVGVGVVVKEGGPVPDVSTPEKLKAAVLAARSLTYTDPATSNTSGAIAGAANLGILDEIKGKTRHAALAVGGELVAKGEVELGFFNLSEIPKGVTVAGALPGPLQGYTVYEAAVLSKGSTDQAATAFVKYLASAAAVAHWLEAKLEPAETYTRTRASQ
jgi:molybdate transport system substrate-binding protein